MKTRIEEIPDELWQLACAREAVVRPLVAAPHIGRAEIEAAAKTLGICRAYVYRLLATYRRRPQTSTLVPKHRGRPQDTCLLDRKVEAVTETAISGFYLTRERPRFSDLMREIEARCHAETPDVPDYRAFTEIRPWLPPLGYPPSPPPASPITSSPGGRTSCGWVVYELKVGSCT
jgi:putative transposase